MIANRVEYLLFALRIGHRACHGERSIHRRNRDDQLAVLLLVSIARHEWKNMVTMLTQQRADPVLHCWCCSRDFSRHGRHWAATLRMIAMLDRQEALNNLLPTLALRRGPGDREKLLSRIPEAFFNRRDQEILFASEMFI